jgi:uncharacterized membrane protein YhaH (DUF805 family)
MKDLSPVGWALRPLKRYAEFSGRSSRAEFWWFMLAVFVVYMVVWVGLLMVMGFGAAVTANASTGAPSPLAMLGAFGAAGIFMVLFWLALLIPTIAVGFRRLHDINRSGWWLGAFYLLYGVYLVLLLGSMGSAMREATAQSSPAAPSVALAAGTGVFALAMFVYAIALLVFYCLPGTKGPNRFGDDPYGADVGEVFA